MPHSKNPPSVLHHLNVNQFDREVNSENMFLKLAKDDLGKTHEPSVQLLLDSVSENVKKCGFASIYDAALAAAKQAAKSNRKSQQRNDLREFADSGGMAELYRFSRSIYHANGTPSEQQEHHQQLVTESVAKILSHEVENLKSCKELRKGVKDFKPELLSSFSVSEVYTTIQKKAPVLISLFDSLMGSQPSPEIVDKDELQEFPEPESNGRHRHIVCSIAILLSNGPCNIVQSFFGYWLYSSRVPKRVIVIMNHIGLSAEEVIEILKKLCSRGNAFQIVFDNVNWCMDVRYERLHNQVGFASAIAAFVVIPSIPRPMFTHADIRTVEALTLTLLDFLPLKEHVTTLFASFRHSLFSVLKAFGEANDLPPLSFKINEPEVEKLDPSHKPTIHCMPLLDLNETNSGDMAEAIRRMRSYVGMSDSQASENKILFKGDLMTVRYTRKAQLHQIHSSPEERLSFVESAFGFLHLQMQVLRLLYRTHFGDKTQLTSLSRWVALLDRNTKKLWNAQGKGHIKEFNSCLDFFETVLDGYLLAVLSTAYGCKTLDAFIGRFGECTKEMLDKIAGTLTKFELVDVNRESDRRDTAHDNLILFLTHGLILRNFSQAMKSGDPERAFASMGFFTFWFQGSSQWQYSEELLRITACLRKVWSPELVAFFKENCLINLSGKRSGWVPDDELNERIVKEVKTMKRNNSSSPAADHHWRHTLTLQTLLFPEAKERMAYECQAFISDYHSTPVESSRDIRAIAATLLNDGICRPQPNRDGSGEQPKQPKQREVRDLFVEGQKAKDLTRRISNLRDSLAFGAPASPDDLVDDIEVEVDEDGTDIIEALDLCW